MIKCPYCEGSNDGSCPTCHAHGYLVAPVEYWLANSITQALVNRLLCTGEDLTTSAVLDLDFWLGWAFERAAHDELSGWGYAHRLAEKRADLAKDAIRPLLKLAGVPTDAKSLPKECSPDFWIERAKARAQERVACQERKIEITTIGSVTESANLLMAS